MKQSKYLITAATGATGSETIASLLANGQQDIRAFVYREDERSEQLRTQGVEIVVGKLLNFYAVKTALQGVNRAYFCFPIRNDLRSIWSWQSCSHSGGGSRPCDCEHP